MLFSPRLKVPTNTGPMSQAEAVRRARAGARTHEAVKPAPAAGRALARLLHPATRTR